MSNFKVQTVVLKTENGSARSEKHLKEVWEDRLHETAPHYSVINVNIKEKSILDILLDNTDEEDGEILVTDFGKLRNELEELV